MYFQEIHNNSFRVAPMSATLPGIPMTPYTYNIAHSKKYANVYTNSAIRINFFNLFLKIVILSEDKE